MTDAAKNKLFKVVAWGLILIAGYSFLGIVQALSLYQGERVLVNLQLWGSIMLSSLVAAVICFIFAARFRRRLVEFAAVR